MLKVLHLKLIKSNLKSKLICHTFCGLYVIFKLPSLSSYSQETMQLVTQSNFNVTANANPTLYILLLCI